MSKELVDVLNSICALLERYEEVGWFSVLERIRMLAVNEVAGARQEIRSLFGGMGSLSDVVLCRDGTFDKRDNDEFDRLRRQLYELSGKS